MADVARLAGVGTMTVSRVLSGTVPVSEATARRVHKAVEQLAYRPNQLARAFRGQRSHTIGLIIPYLYDSFFANCAHSVTSVASEHGFSVITTTSNEDPDLEHAAVEQMLQRHVDGMLVIPARFRQSRLNRALFGRTPVVAFDRPVADPTVDVVMVDNTPGARRALQHLIEHGHERISFLGLSRSLYTINARYLGYHRAMHDARLPESVFAGCNSREDTLQAVERLMGDKHRPTAVFTSNNLVTRDVFWALLHLGVKVPSDLALVGFDDFELAELTHPPLTVVRQPAQELGRVAASLLFERIEREELPRTGKRIALPVELVLRRSCGCRHRTSVVTN